MSKTSATHTTTASTRSIPICGKSSKRSKGHLRRPRQLSALVNAILEHGDYYLVSDDFHSYIETHALVDEAYKNQEEWLVKTITSVARMGFFSSDRCIQEYAETIWNVEPLPPKA
jgi:starch phosphorylase